MLNNTTLIDYLKYLFFSSKTNIYIWTATTRIYPSLIIQHNYLLIPYKIL